MSDKVDKDKIQLISEGTLKEIVTALNNKFESCKSTYKCQKLNNETVQQFAKLNLDNDTNPLITKTSSSLKPNKILFNKRKNDAGQDIYPDFIILKVKTPIINANKYEQGINQMIVFSNFRNFPLFQDLERTYSLAIQRHSYNAEDYYVRQLKQQGATTTWCQLETNSTTISPSSTTVFITSYLPSNRLSTYSIQVTAPADFSGDKISYFPSTHSGRFRRIDQEDIKLEKEQDSLYSFDLSSGIPLLNTTYDVYQLFLS